MNKITYMSLVFMTLILGVSYGQITTYPYFEDFESGDGGWVADNTNNGSWALGAPVATIINTADSGANAWVTNLSGEYNVNEDSWVTSPVFDFTALNAPFVEFSIWWNAEYSWDGMVLQSSIDSGESWQNVGTVGEPNNWYTHSNINGSPGGQQEGWTGREVSNNGSGGWVIARHALVELDGESNVILRFAFGSDGSVQDEGVAFDSVNVFDVSCPEVQGVVATPSSLTEATVTWSAGGSETAWNYEYGVAGFTQGTGTIGTVNTTPSLDLNALIGGTSYDIYVQADCGGDTSGFFMITWRQPPVNDDCSGAIALTPGAVFTDHPVIGRTESATASEVADPSIPAPGCSNYAGGDMWYSVVIPADGNLTIETQGSPVGNIGDTGMVVYSGSCGTLVLERCDDDSGDGFFSSVAIEDPLLAGQTVYVRVFAYANDAILDFQISAFSATLSNPNIENERPFTYFPNPINNQLNLSAQNDIQNVSIYNILGQEVIRTAPNAVTSDIDTTSLIKGAYFVKVTINDKTEISKVIKK